jgi:hypothetical protein
MGKPLTTVARVKGYLGLTRAQQIAPAPTANVDDGLIQALVDAVTPALENYCTRTFSLETWQEIRAGTGTDVLTLSQSPLVDVTSVTLLSPANAPGATPANVPLVKDRDFTFTEFSVVLYCGRFPKGVASVQVVYQAGFATLPSDIVHAATKWCQIRYNEMQRAGQRSKTIAGEVVLFDLSNLPPDVKGIADFYNTRMTPTLTRLTKLS